MTTYNIRWNSEGAAKPNTITPCAGPGGDLVLPQSVIDEMLAGTATLTCDPSDEVAVAVVNAVEFNVQQQLAAITANKEVTNGN